MEILDHGAKRIRAQMRRKVEQHFINIQTANAEKRKGSALTPNEKREVAERSQAALEKRQFHKDH